MLRESFLILYLIVFYFPLAHLLLRFFSKFFYKFWHLSWYLMGREPNWLWVGAHWLGLCWKGMESQPALCLGPADRLARSVSAFITLTFTCVSRLPASVSLLHVVCVTSGMWLQRGTEPLGLAWMIVQLLPGSWAPHRRFEAGAAVPAAPTALPIPWAQKLSNKKWLGLF